MEKIITRQLVPVTPIFVSAIVIALLIGARVIIG
jgi:hypothetical protein